MKNNRPEYLTIADIKAGRDITRGWVGRIGGLLPTQDSILQLKSGGDLKLYEEVAQDDQIQSCMQQRISAITSSDWEIVPGGDKRADLKAAEFIEAQIRNLDWDDTISKMLWGRFYGYSVAELIWAAEADQVSLSDIRVRNRRRFKFDVDQQPRLITYASPQGEALPDQKFWSFCVGADHHDEPYGRGLAHWLYWPSYFKRQDMRWWLHFLEKFAKPTRRGLYPSSATEAEQETLWQAMTGFGNDDQLMVPEGMMVDFLEAQRSGTADYQAMLERCDSAIAKVILSQTMTTDNGSSMAQANVHAGVKEEVVKADADLICGSFNRQVLPWLMGYNPQFGKAALPKLWYRLESEPDLKSQVERDKILFDMGFVPNSDYIRQTYGDGFVLPEADQTALNGTQLQSVLDIVDAIQSGTLSVDVGQDLIGLAVPTIDPEIAARIAQPPTQEPTESADPATSPSLDDVAATFARKGRKKGKGGKNCEKGWSCGGTCISKRKTCLKDMTPEQKALHKKGKKAAGGGGQEEVGAAGVPTLDREKMDALLESYNQVLREKSAYLPEAQEAFSATASARERDSAVIKVQELDRKASDALLAAEKVMGEYHQQLIKTGLKRADAEKLADTTSINLSDPFAKQLARGALVEFHQITNGAIADKVKRIDLVDPRAHANLGQGILNAGDRLTKRVMFHELGHFAESPQDMKTNNKWVRDRGGDTGKLTPLATLLPEDGYGRKEIAAPDSFIHPYVGRYYGSRRDFKEERFGWDTQPTEVMSMGIEQFISPPTMLDLYRHDKEHFDLISDYIGRQRGKK